VSTPPVEAPPPAARVVTVGARRLPGWLAGFVARHGGANATADAHTVLLTGGDGARAWVQVPFPPLAFDVDEPVAALVQHVQRPRTVGVLLVRRGGYAAGVFAGSELVASKVGSSYVQGTTKAGGWSQHRYARRRENQATAAFADAADVAARILLPRLDDLEALVCGGDRFAVDAVLADVRLEPLRPLVTGGLLPVPDPRLKVLQATPEQFRSARIRLDP
jgi:hypothetical protein